MSPEEKQAVRLYPIALDLRGRRCILVGGGGVAARKAEGLLAADACVIVVAPELGEAARAMAAVGQIQHIAARFAPEHLDGAFLAVAATNDAAVNRAVAEAARARGIMLNQAGASPTGDRDDAGESEGDFVTMATVRRGDLLVALTTGGAGPALAARLRRDLDAQFGPEWAEYMTLLREMRDLAKARWMGDAPAKTAALRRLAGAEGVLAALRNGDAAEARREALSCLS